MPRERFERPIFWIVAGPNGSGKTSAYQDADIEAWARSIWIINPDFLAARIRDVEKMSLRRANLQAVIRIESWLEASIRAHQNIGVETVLSTDKYRRLVKLAKSLQFEFRFTYVILDSPARSIERIRLRVAKGGHNVPSEKVIERYGKSLKQMPWFLNQADRALMFDNSDSSPTMIAQKKGAVITLDPKAIPQVARAVQKIKSN
ncbi:MAG TPA: zeta toxin family protein [Pseudorhodoplanes sp.]|nr:zeta toxin family protein [Pseudorhodoplanes sp.]